MAITKPDKAILNTMIQKLTAADDGLGKVMKELEQKKQTVYTSYHMLQGASADQMLKEMDVSELNKDRSGIRIQALYDHNIRTMDQLIGLTPQQLASQVDGIGQESAKKILNKVEEIQKSCEKYATVSLDGRSTNRDMQKLMGALAFIVDTTGPVREMEKLYQTNHAQIAHHLPKVKKMKSALGWMLTSQKTKEACMHSFKQLSLLDVDGFYQQTMDLKKEYRSIARAQSVRKAAADYEANAASFYAVLEQIVGTGTVTGQEGQNYLPTELLTAIDEYPIDLSHMKSTLRNYQVFGTKYILHQRQVLLGDEMGLGKTMQAIAAMAHLKAVGRTHFLVVCPVSVMVNWTREIAKHSDMTAVMIHGSDRSEEYQQWLEEGGIAVTTFETITRLELSEWVTVDMLVVDEAHYVKNPKAQRTQALKRIADVAEYIVFMSGTPLENRVEEMHFLISLLNEEIADGIKNLNSVEVAQAFRERIAPVYLRRVREDVLKELPEKIEKEQWCRLGQEEIKAYREALCDGSYMKVRKVSWNVEDITKSSKANRLLEICEQAKQEERRVIVFSFFLDVIEKIQKILGDRCYGPITGGVSASDRQRIIDEFSQSAPGSVLACQIIAAGTGLNIQSASVVILCEPQWKPSTETQAIARAYRMGQTQTVVVHRLLADDTVDESIMEILRGKTELFENFADESMMGQLDQELLSVQEEKSGEQTKMTDQKDDREAKETGNDTGLRTDASALEKEMAEDIDDRKQQAYMRQIVEEERKKMNLLFE